MVASVALSPASHIHVQHLIPPSWFDDTSNQLMEMFSPAAKQGNVCWCSPHYVFLSRGSCMALPPSTRSYKRMYKVPSNITVLYCYSFSFVGLVKKYFFVYWCTPSRYCRQTMCTYPMLVTSYRSLRMPRRKVEPAHLDASVGQYHAVWPIANSCQDHL